MEWFSEPNASLVSDTESFDPDIVILEPDFVDSMGIRFAEDFLTDLGVPVVALAHQPNRESLTRIQCMPCVDAVMTGMDTSQELQFRLEWAVEKHIAYQNVSQERNLLRQALDRALQKTAFYVKSESRYVKLHAEEILSVEALKDYVIIHTLDEQFTLHTTMKEMERKLPEERFARVHRSHIVHFHKISLIDGGAYLHMEGGRMRIPIGASYKNLLYQRLNFL